MAELQEARIVCLIQAAKTKTSLVAVTDKKTAIFSMWSLFCQICKDMFCVSTNNLGQKILCAALKKIVYVM